jgi:hypothetical protein
MNSVTIFRVLQVTLETFILIDERPSPPKEQR